VVTDQGLRYILQKVNDHFFTSFNDATFMIADRYLQSRGHYYDIGSSYVPKDQEYDFSKDLVPKKTDEGARIWGHRLDGIWMDVGRRTDLIKANLTVARSMDQKNMSFVTESNVYGTLFLGKNASITFSDITDASIMKCSAIVNSAVTRSVVMPGCIIDNAIIIDSVIGENAVIKRGAIIRNCIIGDGEIVAANSDLEGRGGS
jgi:NDP-sugar pyrophosphorylase family protein